MPTIVQISAIQAADSPTPTAEELQASATRIAAVDGLLWKVWIHNAETRERGGVYLFATDAQAQAYVDGPIVAALRANPQHLDLSVKLFDVREEPSLITRAQLTAASIEPVTAD